MLRSSHRLARHRHRHRHHARPRTARRGSALAVVMMFVIAIGAIATSSIMLTSNQALVSKSLDHDRQLKYASEAALEFGKSRLNAYPKSLPDTGYVTLWSNKVLTGADGQSIPNVTTNVYLGKTGSTTGEFGNFVSVVAQALDNHGTGYVRRLELTQESFAKFAYFSNSEGSIVFANGDQLWGPVFSNDVITIYNTGATFHNLVQSAKTISGTSYGTFMKGFQQHAKAVTLPTDAYLQNLLGYATAGNFNFTAPNSGDASQVLMRIEFSPADLNADGDSTDDNEGFVRVYTATAGNQGWLRGDFPGAGSPVTSVLNCGDWHNVPGSAQLKFFPAAVHPTSWFRQLDSAVVGNTIARAESSATLATIMQHANARCYLGGDPHLVATARTAALYPAASARQKGGDDTTFTSTDAYGAWKAYPGTVNALVTAARPADANYLFPIYRGLNPGSQGVIYVAGTTGISGVVRGRLTLYASGGSIVVLDNTRYTSDPSKGVCLDMFGMIASKNVTVADNGLLDPQVVQSSPKVYRNLNSTNYLTLQGVVMALDTGFAVENFSSGPTAVNNCQGSSSGRGCLFLTGGVIQLDRGAVGLTSGQGYVKRYSYDQCAAIHPPPYFPTTGRFADNRYLELSPVGFDVGSLYQSLKP